MTKRIPYGLQDVQLGFEHDVQLEASDVNFPPDLTPKPEKSFLTWSQPHSGHLTEFDPAATSSSNLDSHLVHLNS